jgi:hypothetical protein
MVTVSAKLADGRSISARFPEVSTICAALQENRRAYRSAWRSRP